MVFDVEVEVEDYFWLHFCLALNSPINLRYKGYSSAYYYSIFSGDAYLLMGSVN